MSTAAAFTVLIPARMASSRLPDKPLADLAGVPMVVRVAQQAQRSGAQRTVVAADDARIVQACAAHGVAALLTRSDHPSGSDRLAEACEQLGLADDEIVVNVQGDEPLMAPSLIDAVAAVLAQRPQASMGTAAHPLASVAELLGHIKGPDYPGGGQLISPAADIRQAYETGRGSLKLRARWVIEDRKSVV